MKEDFKKIIYMGLGAMYMTSEKAKDLKEELLEKGQELYDKGVIANEELKHNIKEAIREQERQNDSSNGECCCGDIYDRVRKMSPEEKEKLRKILNEDREKKSQK